MNPPVTAILNEIRDNTKDGAQTLADRALDAMAQVGTLFWDSHSNGQGSLLELTRQLWKVRPSMGAIGVQALLAYDRVCRLMSEDQTAPWGDAVTQAVEIERKRLHRSDALISKWAKKAIGTPAIIATCSYSSTVLNTLAALNPTEVIIAEGHPLLDGLHGAKALQAQGCQVEVVSDTAFPRAINRADAVVIGADQVLQNGEVVNRSGSFALALGARHFGVPFHVVCQSIKITGLHSDGVEIETCPGALDHLPKALKGHAPLFEIVHEDLIDSIITEEGSLAGEQIREFSAQIVRLRQKILG